MILIPAQHRYHVGTVVMNGHGPENDHFVAIGSFALLTDAQTYASDWMVDVIDHHTREVVYP